MPQIQPTANTHTHEQAPHANHVCCSFTLYTLYTHHRLDTQLYGNECSPPNATTSCWAVHAGWLPRLPTMVVCGGPAYDFQTPGGTQEAQPDMYSCKTAAAGWRLHPDTTYVSQPRTTRATLPDISHRTMCCFRRAWQAQPFTQHSLHPLCAKGVSHCTQETSC
jgi:hypothetical protein